MAKNIKELERIIRNLLPPEKYGLKQALLGEIYKDEQGIYLLRDRSNLSSGWECSDAAFLVSGILRERQISNRVCVGHSQDDLANVHLFVLDDPLERDRADVVRDQVGKLQSAELVE